jgi:DNA polymerase III subunit delta'
MAQDIERSWPEVRLLPWHDTAVEQARQAWLGGRFPHALLLQGADGVGKRSFAMWLACAVLCERSTDGTLQCCDNCTSCALIKAGTHPDLCWVAPEEGKQQVLIDPVREATERLSMTSYRQGYKVAVIVPAHLMTPQAANSLLKTLEEPTPGSLLILITSRASALMPTVRSRCQKLTIPRPLTEAALSWIESQTGGRADPALLEFAGGAPLRAVEYANGRFDTLNEDMQKALAALLSGQADVTQVAAEWEKDALPDRLTWLDLWLTSAARGALAGSADLITFPGGRAHLPSLPRTLNISGVYSMVDRARALKAQLGRTALQRELAVESWLIGLLEVLAPARATEARAQQ